MIKRIWLLFLCLSMAAGGGYVVAQEDVSPVTQAMAYVLELQNEDGGFSNGWSPESDLSTTADVIAGLAAVGVFAEGVEPIPAFDPFGFFETQFDGEQAMSVGQLSKVITALVSRGQDPYNFAEQDLIGALFAAQDDAGWYGSGAFDHCLALIALQNAGAAVPDDAVSALIDAQNEDGGWGFMLAELSDTNTTGLCLQALVLVERPEAVDLALSYLSAIQNEDGGWPYQSPSDWGTDSDVNSTAMVLQALIAQGEDLASWRNPQDWLLSMQNESGAFGFQVAVPDDNFLATVAAIPALAGVPLNHWADVLETTD